MVQPVAIPQGIALDAYRGANNYVDCFAATLPHKVDLATYVAAFYTTPLFRVEAVILGLAGHRSTKDDARELAAGRRDAYAAWTVEHRTDTAILMRDVSGRTRSWLAVDGSQVLFGSVVTADKSGDLGALFHLLLPFHKLYARALLWSAVRRLRS